MSKQIYFHMLPGDCRDIIAFLKSNDDIEFTFRDSQTDENPVVANPCQARKPVCLWNKSLSYQLRRQYVADADEGPYYRVDDAQPVLEFTACKEVDWYGQPALLQGRIWGAFKDHSAGYRVWFDALARWLRKAYLRSDQLEGYVSPAVRKWQSQGGILLPMFIPPDTAQWRKFVEEQRSLLK